MAPAGSPVLRTVPAFAGLLSCHWHNKFASRTGCSPPQGGGETAHFSLPRPAFAVWPFQRTLPVCEKVGKAGGLWFARFLVYMRPEGRPFDVLPHLGDGICAATPSVEARAYGLITQPRYRNATDPAPSPNLIPGPDPVPARAMGG